MVIWTDHVMLLLPSRYCRLMEGSRWQCDLVTSCFWFCLLLHTEGSWMVQEGGHVNSSCDVAATYLIDTVCSQRALGVFHVDSSCDLVTLYFRWC